MGICRGHLTSVVLPNGKQLAYGVDALGRRVSRSENGVITHRRLLRSQLQPVAEVDASGELTTRHVYGIKVNVPDYFVRGGITYAVLTDQLGSVRKVVDVGSGGTVQEMQYDTWGVVTLDTNPGFQPFGFAGGVWDGASGLVHFGAREYELATGRWTRKDPIWFGGGSGGLFVYVGGRPSDHSDTSGLRSGDRYRSIDEAGTAAVTEWVPLSRLLDVELGGRLYRLEDGTFSYSDIVYGTPTSVGTGRASIPDGASEVGRFHTHAAPRFGAGDERFSPQDRNNARLHARGLNCEDYLYFLGTPGGLIGIFHPGSESEVPALAVAQTGQADVAADPCSAEPRPVRVAAHAA